MGDRPHEWHTNDDYETVSMPVWKTYLYQLQLQAPKARRVVCQREIHNKPAFYGKEYHGAISREETDALLTMEGDGGYLIRESQRAPGQYTLAIRFEGATKNFKLYFDGQHYVGEKRFDTIQDLVMDGLITFYMESKAADYISQLSSQANYEESPYMAYTANRRKQLAAQKRPRPQRRHRHHQGSGSTRNKANIPIESNRVSQMASMGKQENTYENSGPEVLSQAHRERLVSQDSLSSERSRLPSQDSQHGDRGRLSSQESAERTRLGSQDTITEREPSMGTWLGSDTQHSDRIRIGSDTTVERERERERMSSQESTLREHADNLENKKRIVRGLPGLTLDESGFIAGPISPTRRNTHRHPLSPRKPVNETSLQDLPDGNFPCMARQISFHDTTDGSLIIDVGQTQPESELGQQAKRISLGTNTEGAMLELREPEGPTSPPPSIEVLDYKKSHFFKVHTFRGLHWCDFCANFLWGLIAQGVKCQDCGFNAHKKCSEKVPDDCMPDMKHVKRNFAIDLTTLVKAQNSVIPLVVEVCITEIETRGVHAEGLYRVAGFFDDVEAIKMQFDKDGENTDITTSKYEDINTITSVLKLFFRLLPIPLISFEVYPKIMEAVKQDYQNLDDRLDLIKRSLVSLPPAHYHTLKYLMGHLHRVTKQSQKNMMSPENLAIVFAPTLLRSPVTNPLESLTAVKFERELIDLMIIHHNFLYEHREHREMLV